MSDVNSFIVYITIRRKNYKWDPFKVTIYSDRSFFGMYIKWNWLSKEKNVVQRLVVNCKKGAGFRDSVIGEVYITGRLTYYIWIKNYKEKKEENKYIDHKVGAKLGKTLALQDSSCPSLI